jgi:PAS domain S-box-containing protein
VAKKPTYEELKQKVKELEKESLARKRAEEAMRESQFRFRILFENAPIGLGVATVDGKILSFNHPATQITGYSATELKKINLRDIYLNPDDRSLLLKRFRKEGFVREQEVILKRKDGTSYYASLNILPFTWGGEDVLLTAFTDITERRRAEEEIRKLSSAVEQSIDGIAIGDLEPTLTYVNEAFATMHGYSPDEMTGIKVVNLHNEEQMDEYKRDMNQIKTQGSWVGEIGHIRKDGTPFPTHMSVTLLKDNDGKPIGILAVCRDITEHKRAEEALRQSEERYRSLFENANDAIFIADTKTNIILDANRQAGQLIGRPRQEIIGMHQSELHPPHQAEYYKDKFREHVQKGWVFDLEAEVIKKDGSIVPVFISASTLSIHGKQVIQGLFRDITEEKMILYLKEEIATRKLVEKAKGILMDRYKINEKEAIRRLQKESRRQRKKIKEIAQAVISSELILD